MLNNVSLAFEIMISMYIFKLVVALFDTPFMYIAAKIEKVHNE